MAVTTDKSATRADGASTPGRQTGAAQPQSALGHIKGFLQKFGNDWGMNLASLLAYNFLGAIFPLILGVLALAALVLPASMVQTVATSLNGAVPAAANGANGLN